MGDGKIIFSSWGPPSRSLGCAPLCLPKLSSYRVDEHCQFAHHKPLHASRPASNCCRTRLGQCTACKDHVLHKEAISGMHQPFLPARVCVGRRRILQRTSYRSQHMELLNTITNTVNSLESHSTYSNVWMSYPDLNMLCCILSLSFGFITIWPTHRGVP